MVMVYGVRILRNDNSQLTHTGNSHVHDDDAWMYVHMQVHLGDLSYVPGWAEVELHTTYTVDE